MVTPQARGRGVLEVVIDEKGRVTSAAVRESVHPIYDNLLLSAAAAEAGSLYPMEGGDLSRSNHSLQPSAIHGPLNLKWRSTLQAW